MSASKRKPSYRWHQIAKTLIRDLDLKDYNYHFRFINKPYICRYVRQGTLTWRLGECSYRHRSIRVAIKDIDAEVFDTLLHEIAHSLTPWNLWGYRLNDHGVLWWCRYQWLRLQCSRYGWKSKFYGPHPNST